MSITEEEIERAIAQLARSDKGRQAMRDLLALLQNGGLSLDGDNQLSLLVLLRGAWGPLPGTVRELLVEQVQQA